MKLQNVGQAGGAKSLILHVLFCFFSIFMYQKMGFTTLHKRVVQTVAAYLAHPSYNRGLGKPKI